MSKEKNKQELEHPDITYLKKDDIGLVLAKALNETYQVQPKNPVEFFAKWLLNHSRTARLAQEVTPHAVTLFTGEGKGEASQKAERR